ncbi:MAG: outer membrane protein assembly factor BamB family protein, partial [Croceibacterium sp.]
FYGGNREGMNLHANSINAIDIPTGKLLWSFQVVHHDLWDFDIPQSPKLMTIHKDGKDIPVVIQATKFGYIYVLDRRTGKPVWPVKEVPVPKSDVPGEKAWPTQPRPTWPEPFARQGVFTPDMINPYISAEDQAKVRELLKTARNEGLNTPPSLQGSISLPGHNGGANWGSSAVDPVKHRFFVVSKQMPTFDKLVLDEKPEAQAAMPNGGGDVKPYKSNVDFMLQSNGLPAINPPWSLITAYDMDSGKKIWSLPDGEVTALAEKGIHDTGSTAPRGGPVATGGGLVFVGTSSDRKVRARDAATGKVLWEDQLDAASEGVPAVYEAGGKEYIVFAVGGDGLFPPKLGQAKPGANRYVAFALPSGK